MEGTLIDKRKQEILAALKLLKKELAPLFNSRPHLDYLKSIANKLHIKVENWDD